MLGRLLLNFHSFASTFPQYSVCLAKRLAKVPLANTTTKFNYFRISNKFVKLNVHQHIYSKLDYGSNFSPTPPGS